MRNFINQYAEDLLMFAGLGVIIYATFCLHWIAGLYVTGMALIASSFILSRIKPGGGKP